MPKLIAAELGPMFSLSLSLSSTMVQYLDFNLYNAIKYDQYSFRCYQPSNEILRKLTIRGIILIFLCIEVLVYIRMKYLL